MMSIEYILQLADEAGEAAEANGNLPYVYDFDEGVDGIGAPFPFPNIGSYRPAGWELVEYWTVDKTGWGAEYEPALTVGQLSNLIAEKHADNPGKTIGWAIIEEGQFQLVVGQFNRKYIAG